jgi:hypothetical protein
MKDWERIRKARTDVTDYVIHWTKGKHEEGEYIKPFVILIDILKCGYLKPGFGIRSSIYDEAKRPTIKGPYPAVCFTEQTLDNFVKSCKVLPNRYSPYGIALHKRALYEYGGRPVIYGTEDILGRRLTTNEREYEKDKEIYKDGLPKEYQYLWVRYEPIPNADGYVIDWTHEREWRARVKAPYHTTEGFLPEEGVPILLPALYESVKWVRFFPRILVAKKDEEQLLVEIINAASQSWVAECKNEYLRNYFDQLPKALMVALEEVEGHLEAKEREWARLETIPHGVEEISK